MIEQLADKISGFLALLEGAYKEAVQVSMRKAAEDNAEADEAGKRVQEYMETQGFDASTTEEEIRIRDAVAKAVALKSETIRQRAKAGVEVAQA